MITKTFEVRDRATFIPVLAVKMVPGCEADRYLFGRAGYGTTPQGQGEYVLVARITGGEGNMKCDPFEWPNGARTMLIAHQYIVKNFDALNSGDVVCVEHILGERESKKRSERFEDI